MLQLLNPTEISPLELLARSIESSRSRFNLMDGSCCAMAHAYRLDILKKKGRITSPNAEHIDCVCPTCCDYDDAARKLGIDAETLREIFHGELTTRWERLSRNEVADRLRKLGKVRVAA